MQRSFIAKWIMTSLGLWVASGLLGPDRLSAGNGLWTIAGAGLFLSIINIFVKPLAIFLSLPALILSVGLFLVVVNGAMILLAGKIYGPLFVSGWGSAILAGIIISLFNLLVIKFFEEIK